MCIRNLEFKIENHILIKIFKLNTYIKADIFWLIPLKGPLKNTILFYFN